MTSKGTAKLLTGVSVGRKKEKLCVGIFGLIANLSISEMFSFRALKFKIKVS